MFFIISSMDIKKVFYRVAVTIRSDAFAMQESNNLRPSK